MISHSVLTRDASVVGCSEHEADGAPEVPANLARTSAEALPWLLPQMIGIYAPALSVFTKADALSPGYRWELTAGGSTTVYP